MKMEEDWENDDYENEQYTYDNDDYVDTWIDDWEEEEEW